MVYPRAGTIIWLGVIWLGVGGCASTGLSPLNFSVRHIQDGNRAAVFDAARSALADLGYGIDRADPAAGVIEAQPTRTTSATEPAPTGMRLSSRTRLRQVAYLHVTRGTEIVNVYCKVVVQEQTTEAHRMFRQDHRVSDTPGHTPIDREAATTTEQNTVWQTIRRDKAAERRILEAVLDQADKVDQP